MKKVLVYNDCTFLFSLIKHHVNHMKKIKLITAWEQVVTSGILDHWITMPHHKKPIHT